MVMPYAPLEVVDFLKHLAEQIRQIAAHDSGSFGEKLRTIADQLLRDIGDLEAELNEPDTNAMKPAHRR
jgi:hypothetical protein